MRLGKEGEEDENEKFSFAFFSLCFGAATIAAGKEVETATSGEMEWSVYGYGLDATDDAATEEGPRPTRTPERSGREAQRSGPRRSTAPPPGRRTRRQRIMPTRRREAPAEDDRGGGGGQDSGSRQALWRLRRGGGRRRLRRWLSRRSGCCVWTVRTIQQTTP